MSSSSKVNCNEDFADPRGFQNMSGQSGVKKRWFLPKTQRGRIVLYSSIGILFGFGSFFGVNYSIETEKTRRHLSIARDIERERWRRKQLGLPEKDEFDDGFAQVYESQEKNKLDVELAKQSIENCAKNIGKTV